MERFGGRQETLQPEPRTGLSCPIKTVLDRDSILRQPRSRSLEASLQMRRQNPRVLVLPPHSFDDLRYPLPGELKLPPGLLHGDPPAPVPSQAASDDGPVPHRARGRRKLPKLILESSAPPGDENALQLIVDGFAAPLQEGGQVSGGPTLYPLPQPESDPSQRRGERTQRAAPEISLAQERLRRKLNQISDVHHTQPGHARADAG